MSAWSEPHGTSPLGRQPTKAATLVLKPLLTSLVGRQGIAILSQRRGSQSWSPTSILPCRNTGGHRTGWYSRRTGNAPKRRWFSLGTPGSRQPRLAPRCRGGNERREAIRPRRLKQSGTSPYWLLSCVLFWNFATHTKWNDMDSGVF